MKFFAEPNLYVTDFRTKKHICKFDENGEFETEDNNLIERLKPNFRYEEKPVKKRR